MCNRVIILLLIICSDIFYLPILASWSANPLIRLRQNSSAPEAIIMLKTSAIELYLEGQFDQSLNLYDEAIAQAKRLYGANSCHIADLYFEMGLVALSSSKFKKAEDLLNQAVRLNPNAVTARLKLAELLKLKGHPQEARIQAQHVLARHHDSMAAREILALSYQETGNLAKATKECFYLDAVSREKRTFPPVVMPVLSKIQVHPQLETKNSKNTATTKALATSQINHKTKIEQKLTKKPAKPKIAKVLARQKPKILGQKLAKTEKVRLTSEAVLLTTIKRNTAGGGKSAAQSFKDNASTRVPGKSSNVSKGLVKHMGRGKLIPPPPPVVPVFPQVVIQQPATNAISQTRKTHTNSTAERSPTEKRQEKGKEKNAEPAKEDKLSHPLPTSDDADFLIDWAADKGKKGRN